MHGNLFFGWKVVAAAFVAAVFAWGIGLYGPPVFVHALHAGRGWPVSTIAAAVTIHFLISAGFVIWLSDIHRRIGLAWTTRLGALGLGAGAVAWALADAPAHLFGAALITGAGSAGRPPTPGRPPAPAPADRTRRAAARPPRPDPDDRRGLRPVRADRRAGAARHHPGAPARRHRRRARGQPGDRLRDRRPAADQLAAWRRRLAHHLGAQRRAAGRRRAAPAGRRRHGGDFDRLRAVRA